MDEYLDLPATEADTVALIGILVRECGCGCTFTNGELRRSAANCTVVRTLRDRRFLLGILFARTLRHQLEAEEWCQARPPIPPRSREGAFLGGWAR